VTFCWRARHSSSRQASATIWQGVGSGSKKWTRSITAADYRPIAAHGR
jgi:hypothetical protein